MSVTSSVKMQKTETEVAVLQVQVHNIENDISEIKTDIKEFNVSMSKNNDDLQRTLKDMKDSSTNAHRAMSEKISALEKWRWMMMGAGIVLGSMGSQTLANLLK